MGFRNESEVKMHLSLRECNGNYLYRPVAPSDAFGYLGQKPRRSYSALTIAETPRHRDSALDKTTSMDGPVNLALVPVSTTQGSAQV
jgi:hypothetical protein